MIKRILELLYPSVCIFCGKLCKEGICEECRKKVPYIREPRCKKCGKPIRRKEKEFCYDCEKNHFQFEQGRSLWLHKEPVSSSVYAFKYKNRRVYGEVYAEEMAKRFERLVRSWEIDVIMPVPLHRRRLRKRGYNQAQNIAKNLGRILEIPVDASSLVREKYTEPQKALGHGSRRKNLKNAFRVRDAHKIKYKNVLLIDDIYTTGSTIDSISQTLKRAGCEKIYFLTISIGQGF